MRRAVSFAAASLLLAALAACGGEDAAPRGPTRRIRLPDGPEVVVPARPERIVSTLPGITEMVAHLDDGIRRLVAVSPHCDTPATVRALPRVAVLPLSLEALASHRPDVILVDGTLLRVSLPDLRRRFGAVVPLDSRSLDGLRDSFDLLAQVLGTEEAAARAREFGARLDEVRREVAGRGGARPKVLLLGQPEPLHVLGPGSLLDDMVRAAGGENVAADLGRASGPFALETVRARAPDWILTVGSRLPDALRRSWADLPAVKDGHVADASADDLVRAGPRTPDALRRLAQVLRGELPPERLSPRDGDSR